jgi:hypothetical protein
MTFWQPFYYLTNFTGIAFVQNGNQAAVKSGDKQKNFRNFFAPRSGWETGRGVYTAEMAEVQAFPPKGCRSRPKALVPGQRHSFILSHKLL